MSLKSAPYYWIECDGCEVKHQSDFSAWSDPETAEEYASESEWTTDGVKWHCYDCPPLCSEDHYREASGLDGEEWECSECSYVVAYDAARNEWVSA